MGGNQQVNGVVAAAAVELTAEARTLLERAATAAKAAVRDAMRARIVLAAAEGLSNAEIARRLPVAINTVRKWRGRFAALGPTGLADADRAGRPRQYGDLVRVAVVAAVTSRVPDGAAAWTHAAIAERVAATVFAPVSPAWAGRVLAGLDLKPHKVTGWLTRRDTPEFWERARDLRVVPQPAGWRGRAVRRREDRHRRPLTQAPHPPRLPRAPGTPGVRIHPPRHRLTGRRPGRDQRRSPHRGHHPQQRRCLHHLP
ncbi:helix-turn-helix domain-containing protein [Streptomyces sp. Edi4]